MDSEVWAGPGLAGRSGRCSRVDGDGQLSITRDRGTSSLRRPPTSQ